MKGGDKGYYGGDKVDTGRYGVIKEVIRGITKGGYAVLMSLKGCCEILWG